MFLCCICITFHLQTTRSLIYQGTCQHSTPVAQPSSVSTVLPVHLCSNNVSCVSCGGRSFLTGLPRAFHVDATASFMSSVLHKDVCVDLPGWAARSRCRVVGTGEAGAGKSPCFDPNRQLLWEFIADEERLSPVFSRQVSRTGRYHARSCGRSSSQC